MCTRKIYYTCTYMYMYYESLLNDWCRFGLKGKVDVTLTMGERRGRGGERVLSHRVPLELKTGKMYRKQGTVEHRAQVSHCMHMYMYMYLQLS